MLRVRENHHTFVFDARCLHIFTKIETVDKSGLKIAGYRPRPEARNQQTWQRLPGNAQAMRKHGSVSRNVLHLHAMLAKNKKP